MNQPTPFELLQGATMPYAMLPEAQRFDRWREIQAAATPMSPVHIAPVEQPVPHEPAAQEAVATSAQEAPAPVPPRPVAQRTRRDAYDGILRRHAQAARQAVFTPVTPP